MSQNKSPQEFLHRIASDIAVWMSPSESWHVSKVHDTGFHLAGPDGMGLIFWCGGSWIRSVEDMRFEVSGIYPDVYVSPNAQPRITLGLKKGARAIAKDVEGRFLSNTAPCIWKPWVSITK